MISWKTLKPNWPLVLIMLCSAAARIAWLQTTISRDEGGEAIIAMMWLRGVQPFYWLNIQPPGIYTIFSAFIVLFGNSIIPIRVFNDLLFLLSQWALFKIAVRIYGRGTALATVAFYGSAMNLPILEGMFVQTEPISTALIIVSFYLLTTSKNYALYLSAGILMGMAGMIRPTQAVSLFTALYIIFNSKVVSIRSTLLTFLAGIFFVLTGYGLFFLVSGNLFDFLGIFVRPFQVYFGVTPDVPTFVKIAILLEAIPLWIFAGIGAFYVASRRTVSNLTVSYWAVPLTALSLIPPTFGHHFIPILPAVSILAAIGLIKSVNFLGRLQTRLGSIGHGVGSRLLSSIPRLSLGLILIGLLAISAPLVVNQYPAMTLQWDGGTWLYSDAGYQTQVALSQYLLTHTKPLDSIFVHGWASEIYWMTGKSPPSKYVWSRDLLPPDIRDQMIDYIRAKDFRYFVVFAQNQWEVYSRAEFSDPLLKAALQNYFLETTIGSAYVYSSENRGGLYVNYSLTDNYFHSNVSFMTDGLFSQGIPQLNQPRVTIASINDEIRYVIEQVPFKSQVSGDALRSTVSYNLTVPANAEMSFAMAIDEPYWQETAGATFEVIASTQVGRFIIFNQTIDPAISTVQRNWNDRTVPLVQFSGQQIRLELTTLPGQSGDNAYSIAFWGNPAILAALTS